MYFVTVNYKPKNIKNFIHFGVKTFTWIVEDYQPLTVVDGQEFRQFCYEMDPCFQVPRPALIKTKIQEFVLFAEKQLFQLQDATEQLAKSLCQHSEIQQRKDSQKLEELIALLAPFAQMTELIGGSLYLTLSMMLPTISRLFAHLDKMKESLVSSNILDESIQNKLSEMIVMVTDNIDTSVQTEMDHFYDEEIQTEHLIDDEFECYKKVIQMNKYQINYPLYKSYNPLI
ncbi:17759_t:CDS:2, partial [Gigaspora margarita]